MLLTRDVAPLHTIGTARLGGPLIDGSPLIEVPVTATGPHPEVDVEFTERAHISVTQIVKHQKSIVFAMHIDLLAHLDAIANEVRRIFQVFVREFV